MRTSVKNEIYDLSVKENHYAFDRPATKDDDEHDEDYDILEEEEETVFEQGKKYKSEELIEFADKLLRAD